MKAKKEDNENTKYYCKRCGTELEINQKICPACGYNKIIVKKTVELKIPIRSNLKIRQKHEGFKQFIREIIQGWFPSGDKKKHPEGVEKRRIIDREKNKYLEEVKDIKTGIVTHNIQEPLDQHKNQHK